MKPYPTADEIRRFLDYCPETGVFVWRHRHNNPAFNKRWSGNVAGKVTAYGYIQIRMMLEQYMAHRLAWILLNDKEPMADIDHINLNRSDNRAVNLRACTRSENKANTLPPITNPSGPKGVNWLAKARKSRARIKVMGREKHLGLFSTKEEAAAAYRAAATEHFGQFARAA